MKEFYFISRWNRLLEKYFTAKLFYTEPPFKLTNRPKMQHQEVF